MVEGNKDDIYKGKDGVWVSIRKEAYDDVMKDLRMASASMEALKSVLQSVLRSNIDKVDHSLELLDPYPDDCGEDGDEDGTGGDPKEGPVPDDGIPLHVAAFFGREYERPKRHKNNKRRKRRNR